MKYTQLGACFAAAFVATIAVADGRVIDDAAIADTGNTSEWLAYGRNHNEQRFAPLDQIKCKKQIHYY